MITEAAAPDVQFIFGAAFKEDMQDEMTVTVIAADFGGTSFSTPRKAAKKEEPKSASGFDPAFEVEAVEEPLTIDNPLLDDKMDFGQPAAPKRPETNDFDMQDIFDILGGR